MVQELSDDAREWDAFYVRDGSGRHAWSGEPNATLVAEVADLAPGTALDVGCGEGADAIWLARRGWRVTAVDPSRVALDRAELAAQSAGVAVTWIAAGLLEQPDRAGPFDLVTAHYAVLRKTSDDAAIRTLLGGVAPGGTLLIVDHDLETAHADHDGFDPAGHVMPADVADHLDDTWQIEVWESRPRPDPVAAAAHHVRDLVLRARRRAIAVSS